jgi:hypothetical protein
MAKRKKKSSKGALIKGMSKKIPKIMLDDISFRNRMKDILRGYSGIYALYNGHKLYYVGLAKDLFWRLHSHGRNRHKEKWDSFVIFRIKRVNYLKDIETLVMSIVDLPGNRVKGKVPKDADINRLLKEIINIEAKKVQKLRKTLRNQ